jgi:hypothetical protein
MRDLIKGAVICTVISGIVTVSVSALTSLGGEPEYSIVRAIRADRSTEATSSRCAPAELRCLPSESGS